MRRVRSSYGPLLVSWARSDQWEHAGIARRRCAFDPRRVHDRVHGQTERRSHGMREIEGSIPSGSMFTGRHVPRRRAGFAIRLRRVRFASCPRHVFAGIAGMASTRSASFVRTAQAVAERYQVRSQCSLYVCRQSARGSARSLGMREGSVRPRVAARRSGVVQSAGHKILTLVIVVRAHAPELLFLHRSPRGQARVCKTRNVGFESHPVL